VRLIRITAAAATHIAFDPQFLPSSPLRSSSPLAKSLPVFTVPSKKAAASAASRSMVKAAANNNAELKAAAAAFSSSFGEW